MNLGESYKKKYAVNPVNWKRYAALFQIFGRLAKFADAPLIGKTLKRFILLDRPEKNHTQGYVINLNRDLAGEQRPENVVLPIDLVYKAIRESSYRAIMHRCLCRDGGKCGHYPVDLGCVFIGEGSRVVEERGIARPASVEEALAHVDRAADLGLVSQCLWVEAEQYVWGIADRNMHRFLEICFCCPCCCIGLGHYRETGPDIRSRFRSIGWKAVVGQNCTGCGECVTVCPMRTIAIGQDAAVVGEECLGCGICASRCSQGAIAMTPVKPLKEDIRDYFWGFRPDV